jgi:hypothetical protein
LTFGVLPTIDLNNEIAVATEEIDHIGPNRLLTHKLETGQSPITHGEPKFRFGVSRICPQLADTSGRFAIWSPHQWPLTRLASSMLATLSPQERGEGKEFVARAEINPPPDNAGNSRARSA